MFQGGFEYAVSERWLVTGGLGFIGSHFIRFVLEERPDVSVVNFDAMTYAGNPVNVADLAGGRRYAFIKGNVGDEALVDSVVSAGVDVVVNFAAESHVDRSILDPSDFVRTNVLGTHVLLEAARKHGIRRFLQVSSDEVYGARPIRESKEGDALAPQSPYAASKAAGELHALAHWTTYATPVLITRASNTYGPFQYPEKIVPLFVTNLIDDIPVPLYGDGLQVREWLHVDDHVRGILRVLDRGRPGEAYNLGSGNLQTNLSLTEKLLELCDRRFDTHVRFVADRPGHDRRYSSDSSKARALGWSPQRDFVEGLAATVRWYRENETWWRPMKAARVSR